MTNSAFFLIVTSCFYLQVLEVWVYFVTGEFAIRADKKTDPVTKKASKVGMIAGGTGKYIHNV